MPVGASSDEISSDQVRAELTQILASPPFRASRRCSDFLRYVTEKTLAGSGPELKERSIGVEVFRRRPDYDSNTDPVVRVAAADVRKRLDQYYLHYNGGNLRLHLAPGSYAPEFQLVQQVPPAAKPFQRRSWVLGLAAAAAGILLLALASGWLRPSSSEETALEKFWAPFLKADQPVLLCIGQPSGAYELPKNLDARLQELRATNITPGPEEGRISVFELQEVGAHFTHLADSFCSSRIAAWLLAHNKKYVLRGARSTSFAEIRENPTICIGAFNNPWTLNLTADLPLVFKSWPGGLRLGIINPADPEGEGWSLISQVPQWDKLTEDYAMVARVLNPTTGQFLVVAAGITAHGTMAAGEFLSNPQYFESAVASAPDGWENHNVQIVLRTKVVSGDPARPTVEAARFWPSEPSASPEPVKAAVPPIE